METNKIIWGDCTLELKDLPDESVDAIITDPPYGLEFMGKDWDKFNKINSGRTRKENEITAISRGPDKYEAGVPFQKFTYEWAKECLRVLKSGGYLLSFGGTRTYHRMACAIEDAGFEIRDMIEWVYGSGFPKSLNIGKAVDKLYTPEQLEVFKKIRDKFNLFKDKKQISIKEINEHFAFATNGSGMAGHWFANITQQTLPTKDQYIELKKLLAFDNELDYLFINLEKGNERPIIGIGRGAGSKGNTFPLENKYNLTSPATKEAKQWEGWGTALKPAHEPIVVARKPLSEKTVAQQVLKNGCGGINIDESRIGTEERKSSLKEGKTIFNNEDNKTNGFHIVQGRFPANLIHDGSDEVLKEFEKAGISGNGNFSKGSVRKTLSEDNGFKLGFLKGNSVGNSPDNYGDIGTPARFFKSCPFELEDYAPFYYTAKASKGERNEGTDSFINIEVFNMKCENKQEEKSLIQGERLARLSVDMGTLQIKDIEESGIQKKEDLGWNTILFGKEIMEKYQQDFQSIIKMKTNSTILLKTWNWLMHLLTKEYTLDVNSLMENGGNLVENVDKSRELIITMNEKLELALGVKNVVSGMQLKIKLSEGKCSHPTVKPLKLMEYLIKLVSREGAIILDPFLGSGTTAVACLKTNRQFIGIEKEDEYIKIAEARIKPYLEQTKLISNNIAPEVSGS